MNGGWGERGNETERGASQAQFKGRPPRPACIELTSCCGIQRQELRVLDAVLVFWGGPVFSGLLRWFPGRLRPGVIRLREFAESRVDRAGPQLRCRAAQVGKGSRCQC